MIIVCYNPQINNDFVEEKGHLRLGMTIGIGRTSIEPNPTPLDRVWVLLNEHEPVNEYSTFVPGKACIR